MVTIIAVMQIMMSQIVRMRMRHLIKHLSRIKSEKYVILRHVNQLYFLRNATEVMFHTLFQQEVYHVYYAKKKFANYRFVKCSYLGQNPLYNGLHRLLQNVNLDSLVSLRYNFHAKAIHLFYATILVSLDHDHII